MDFYTDVLLIGDDILYRGYSNGESVQYREKCRPTLFFVPSDQSKASKYKTLDGRNAHPKRFDGARDAREFIQKYENVDGLEVHGYDRFVYQYIADKFPDEIRFDMDLMKIYTIDIEVGCDNGFPSVEECQEEILCITIKNLITKDIVTWGTREFAPRGTEYRVFWKEHEMLSDFHKWWTENTPDIVTGWNCNLYDIPYICRRLERVLGEKWKKSLSPWNRVLDREFINMGRKQIAYEIGGVTILDYLDLYKKFTYSAQESYRLDHIASVELGQKKVDHSEYENFKEFYTKDWQKFVEYNIVDVELVDRLEDKMKLIELALTLAYDAKVNLGDVYSQVRMWDTLIYNDLKKRNIVVPPKVSSTKDDQYAGAYVKEPAPGMYEWVVSFDLNSLYPHLIMQYNISPETLVDRRHPTVTVDKLLSKEVEISGEYAVCANGAQYRKDVHGFLPEMMQRIYDERKIYKKRMLHAKQEYETAKTVALQKDIARYNNIQMARKIQLNSAYGAIGNQYFRYYNLANAEAITLSGQVSIRWIENKINGYLNKILQTDGEDYVIASDTDSIYLNLGPLVTKFLGSKSDNKAATVSLLNKICQDKLEPFIDNSYQELADYVSAYEQKMQMKRENIADKGIWTAKKRYILNVWDSEGVRYEEPKLKMMGIEAVKSSTPAPCRTAIKETLNLVMTSTEDAVQKHIAKFRKQFESLPIEEISFPRSCNNMGKFSSPKDIYGKGCPMHVRGSLLYNYYLKQLKLTHKFPLIQEGEKIKYLYLRKPNRIGENVISFFQTLPKEFELDGSIDYDLQFEKSFLSPVKVILDAIGWTPEKRITLEHIFG
ncbi:DNA polymerase [Synechococcus phage S-SZBM1]|uniref:DNA polymerase n=1 Tax=Synechococcus phage S-SZBM1 TaxID=2926475 RepID=A0AC61TTT6_9CAUD|nr:DNA polymerase [Synechococcus phage S-SZBM1]UNH61265.1 DNA polymerase [Synechococcus phage S-SZBM1]